MPQIITSDLTASANYTVSTFIDNDVIFVRENVLVSNTSAEPTVYSAIGVFNQNNRIGIEGTVMGAVGPGIYVVSANLTVNVSSTGSILSFGTTWDAMNINSTGARIFNDGEIVGMDGAVISTANDTTVFNTGLISGVNTGVTGAARVDNLGTIRGTTAVSMTSGDDTLVNTGTLAGTVILGQGLDRFDNRGGEVLGDVDLGLGNDVLDNRGGSVSGLIDMGDGADMFILGAGAETAEGGLGGQDFVDARSGAGGVIDLLEDRGTGLALGDVLTGFERVWGSASGSDTIYGNSSSNLLYGQGGNDLIEGDTGSDILYGGRGIDTLTGGAGSESFGFLNLAEIGDVITDFSSTGSGNDDRIIIRAASFGGGLVAGALNPAQFQSRADNVAQDSNDRFIFRTTDRTLWFDADGPGAGGAVLVASLQAGATLTALDILLI